MDVTEIGVNPAPIKAAENKQTLRKSLPTKRVAVSKQLDLLRAYVALSERGSKPVRVDDVSALVKLHPVNVSSANPFFLENGFLERRERGLMPTAWVIEYFQAHTWAPETAAIKLAPLVVRTWFGELLLRQLSYKSLTENEAIQVLAADIGATPEYRAQIRQLLEYLVLSLLVREDNGSLQLTRSSDFEAAPTVSVVIPEPEQPHVAVAPPTPVVAAPLVSMQQGADGGIRMQVNVDVSLSDLKGWPADRITAFFGGLAQVVAAQQK